MGPGGTVSEWSWGLVHSMCIIGGGDGGGSVRVRVAYLCSSRRFPSSWARKHVKRVGSTTSGVVLIWVYFSHPYRSFPQISCEYTSIIDKSS